jgi:stress-induced-phosphoprotein 1
VSAAAVPAARPRSSTTLLRAAPRPLRCPSPRLAPSRRALDSYQAALKLEPDNAEAKEGLTRTVERINSSAGNTKMDEERARRAMEDPEVQAILRDPMVSQAIQDMQSDPRAMGNVMRDPAMAAKIKKLIAAGILGMG